MSGWRVKLEFKNEDVIIHDASSEAGARQLADWWTGHEGCTKAVIIPPKVDKQAVVKRIKELKAIIEADSGFDEGYPVRDTIISKDEITNLAITLNTIEDIDELVAVI